MSSATAAVRPEELSPESEAQRRSARSRKERERYTPQREGELEANQRKRPDSVTMSVSPNLARLSVSVSPPKKKRRGRPPKPPAKPVPRARATPGHQVVSVRHDDDQPPKQPELQNAQDMTDNDTEVDDDDEGSLEEEEVTIERLIAEYGAANLEFVVEGDGGQQAVSLGEFNIGQLGREGVKEMIEKVLSNMGNESEEVRAPSPIDKEADGQQPTSRSGRKIKPAPSREEFVYPSPKTEKAKATGRMSTGSEPAKSTPPVRKRGRPPLNTTQSPAAAHNKKRKPSTSTISPDDNTTDDRMDEATLFETLQRSLGTKRLVVTTTSPVKSPDRSQMDEEQHKLYSSPSKPQPQPQSSPRKTQPRQVPGRRHPIPECANCSYACSVNYRMNRDVYQWRCKKCRNWQHVVDDPDLIKLCQRKMEKKQQKKKTIDSAEAVAKQPSPTGSNELDRIVVSVTEADSNQLMIKEEINWPEEEQHSLQRPPKNSTTPDSMAHANEETSPVGEPTAEAEASRPGSTPSTTDPMEFMMTCLATYEQLLNKHGIPIPSSREDLMAARHSILNSTDETSPATSPVPLAATLATGDDRSKPTECRSTNTSPAPPLIAEETLKQQLQAVKAQLHTCKRDRHLVVMKNVGLQKKLRVYFEAAREKIALSSAVRSLEDAAQQLQQAHRGVLAQCQNMLTHPKIRPHLDNAMISQELSKLNTSRDQVAQLMAEVTAAAAGGSSPLALAAISPQSAARCNTSTGSSPDQVSPVISARPPKGSGRSHMDEMTSLRVPLQLVSRVNASGQRQSYILARSMPSGQQPQKTINAPTTTLYAVTSSSGQTVSTSRLNRVQCCKSSHSGGSSFGHFSKHTAGKQQFSQMKTQMPGRFRLLPRPYAPEGDSPPLQQPATTGREPDVASSSFASGRFKLLPRGAAGGGAPAAGAQVSYRNALSPAVRKSKQLEYKANQLRGISVSSAPPASAAAAAAASDTRPATMSTSADVSTSSSTSTAEAPVVSVVPPNTPNSARRVTVWCQKCAKFQTVPQLALVTQDVWCYDCRLQQSLANANKAIAQQQADKRRQAQEAAELDEDDNDDDSVYDEEEGDYDDAEAEDEEQEKDNNDAQST